jgi:hypothetical protein
MAIHSFHSSSLSHRRPQAWTHRRHCPYGKNRGPAFKKRCLFCSSSLNFSTLHDKSSNKTPLVSMFSPISSSLSISSASSMTMRHVAVVAAARLQSPPTHTYEYTLLALPLPLPLRLPPPPTAPKPCTRCTRHAVTTTATAKTKQ